ncbi:hypothetical protein CE91St56_05860 [Lachnospiraceae bacterium]|nr:hypothetical protein CE91St56_05860 [Lachnospiraceae bacterium]GKH39613.1 hypothetical protein CE91St57_05870 [Lachnospiraceae bacterium]
MSGEADTLDRSYLHGLKGTGENSFSVPGIPLWQRADGHLAPAKSESVVFTLSQLRGECKGEKNLIGMGGLILSRVLCIDGTG